jgi:predicted glutamine amidotransferase
LAKRTASAAVPAKAAKPSEAMFVVAHVRQALQQTVAMGACSPYFPAA